MKKKDSKNIVIKRKYHKKRKDDFIKVNILIIKILIIAFIVFGFYFTQKSYDNTISLLAVTEDSNGAPTGGSIVELSLQVKPGTGQIYTNLNTIEEIDTQISIINSQKIACSLFSLDCENYDFFYNFKGSALVLKGPSASSAIAILATKTVKREPISEKIVITGSLNSG
jgi:predicted S18 family serine protease